MSKEKTLEDKSEFKIINRRIKANLKNKTAPEVQVQELIEKNRIALILSVLGIVLSLISLVF